MEKMTEYALILASRQTLPSKHIMLLYDNAAKKRIHFSQANAMAKEIPNWLHNVVIRRNYIMIDECVIWFGTGVNSLKGRSLNLVFLDNSYDLEELQGWYGAGFCRFIKGN